MEVGKTKGPGSNYWIWVIASLPIGALYPFAFAPYDRIYLGLIPYLYLLHVVCTHSLIRSLLLSCTLGCGAFFSGFHWLYQVSQAVPAEYGFTLNLINTGIILMLVSIGFVLPVLLSRLIFAKHSGLSLAFFALVFTLCEWLRSVAFTGFGHLQPGYLLLDTPFAPLAKISGVFALTLVFFGLVVILYSLLYRRTIKSALPLILIVFFWMGVTLDGGGEASITESKPTFTARIIHDNLSTEEKQQYHIPATRLQRYLSWSAEPTKEPNPLIIIWPEGSVEPGYGLYRQLYKQVPELHQQNKHLLFGSYTEGYPAQYNALSGGGQLQTYYRKRHLIPFGEYTPQLTVPFFNLSKSLPDVRYNALNPGEEHQAVGEIAGYRFRTAICFEILFGDELRQPEEDFDFIINISDLSWFSGTPLAEQLLQVARMRALELGKPLIRSTNFGVSSVIDAQGNVLRRQQDSQPGYIDVQVTPQSGSTLYLKYGVFPLLFVLIMLTALLPLSSFYF